MTQTTGTHRTSTTPLTLTGTGLLALALLTGCSTADDPASGPAGNGAATEAPASTASPSASGTATSSDDDHADDDGSGSPTSTASAAVADGADPVFAAIDAVLAAHAGAVIVQIDQDDNDTRYEVEAVVGDRVLELDVAADGTVTEDGQDTEDSGDVRKAQGATVTAEEAARTALEGRDGSTVDSLGLDDDSSDDNTDDAALHWEVELDNAQGEDDTELRIDATTGEVR
jgi:uncharacterized membrane protein YkoI